MDEARTYLRRRGRLTRGQARAWNQYHEQMVAQAPGDQPDWSRWFGRSAPLGVEIGFGMGHALVAWAQARPQWNLVGVDVYQPGVGSLLLGLEAAELDNVRVLEMDARLALSACFESASIDEARVFFPDPWPKKRHHKRRLIQPPFVDDLAAVLKPGAQLLIATDWEDYAHWIRQVLRGSDDFVDLYPDQASAPRPETRPETRFEARGVRLGHTVCDLAYVRKR
tara:strand:+ start:4311 stop:4982 length:672 start_codon:yes stop_codon:yes gene_type:complete